MARTPKGTPPSHPGKPHKGQARITIRLIDGRRHDLLLGPFGSPESRAEYRRVLAELEAGGGRYPLDGQGAVVAGLTVSELILRFWRHAEGHYRLADGSPSRELDHYQSTLSVITKSNGGYLHEMITGLLLEQEKVSGSAPHPLHLLLGIRAATVCWKESRRSPSEEEQWFRRILQLLDRAYAACEQYPVGRPYHRLSLITQHSVLLKRRGLGPQETPLLRNLDRQALDLLDNGVGGKSVPVEWYEGAGDDIPDHREAERLYRWGATFGGIL